MCTENGGDSCDPFFANSTQDPENIESESRRGGKGFSQFYHSLADGRHVYTPLLEGSGRSEG